MDNDNLDEGGDNNGQLQDNNYQDMDLTPYEEDDDATLH